MPDLPDGFPHDPAPDWQDEPPTAEGWYPWRYGPEDDEPVPRVIDDRGMTEVFLDNGKHKWIDAVDLGGQWWPIPIEMPGG